MADFTRKQKIEKIMKTYNISEERATYIVTEDENYLSIEDLKIKYDNPNMGVLPDWLTDEELSNMIWKTIHKRKNYILLRYATVEDIYQDVQLHIRKNSNKLKNHSYVKAMIGNYILNIISDNKMVTKYIPLSIDQTLYPDETNKNENVGRSYSDFISDLDTQQDNELLTIINSIGDKDIKKLLIVVGYLLCDIMSLEKMYKDVINSSSEKVQHNLREIEQQIHDNKNIELLKLDGIKTTRRKVLTAKEIIVALEMNLVSEECKENGPLFDVYKTVVKSVSPSDVLSEVKYYIKNNKYFEDNGVLRTNNVYASNNKVIEDLNNYSRYLNDTYNTPAIEI